MVYPAFKYTSPEAYLEMEQTAFEKHEYIVGALYAMAGATERHILIVGNIAGALHSILKGRECREYSSDLRVVTPLADNYMYPDLTIVCGATELKPDCFDTLTNPSVIIEVLSAPTEERDRALKFFFYRQIPSFKEYILVDTGHCRITTFLKQEDGTWEEGVTEGLGNKLTINTIGAAIPVQDIYARVDMRQA